MPGSGYRGLYVEIPEELYIRVKTDAVTRRLQLREWLQEAARAKLAGGCPCEEEPAPAGE
jgi:hypothetical protein